MFTEILAITNFIVEAFIHIWPYLLITIPLAVAVQMSGASKYISTALQARPATAILAATAVGAFSPFCSCGVIPMVAALLIGGVPLAPVMAFWISSPSMDPEIFFLSVATLGWELAVWRLVATLILSLVAGFGTHLLVQRGWLGENILRPQILNGQSAPVVGTTWSMLKGGWQRLRQRLTVAPTMGIVSGGFSRPSPSAQDNEPVPVAETSSCCSSEPITVSQPAELTLTAAESSCCSPAPATVAIEPNVSLNPEVAESSCCGNSNAPMATSVNLLAIQPVEPASTADSCCTPAPTVAQAVNLELNSTSDCCTPAPIQLASDSCGCGDATEGATCAPKPASFRQRLLKETWVATAMVVKFMALAFFLEALITLYVPSTWIIGILGPQNPLAILTAALIGVPFYTSSLAALPLISGLLAQGMNPAAGLAFLIAGPTTTLPAMAAVWGLVNRRVFGLYVAFSMVGAVALGYVYGLVAMF